MVIGIIGAGIAGLTAGRLLAKSGHEVTIIEKSKGYGGRMATRYAGKEFETELDHGLSYFTANSPEFQSFVVELLEQSLIKRWGDNIALFDGETLYKKSPNLENKVTFAATQGMNSIGKYLSRWVDVKTETLAGGLTHIGSNRSKKRTWMINLTASNTFEADAVIIAIPAPQAYGILQTAVDEIQALKIIREIDDISYSPCYSLMLGYGEREIPDWEGVQCQNGMVQFISNEVSKKSEKQECSLVVHTTPGFTRSMYGQKNENIIKEILDHLPPIIGSWSATPEWSQLHYWRYSRAEKTLDRPYMELDFEEAPLALIGDYFNGNSVDDAYRSGYLLAKEWINKYND